MSREKVYQDWKNRKQECALEIIEAATGKREVVATFDQVIEAPNWTKDGKALIYNQSGLIYRFDLEKRVSERIDTGFADLCNNDHVISSDGKYLAVSHFVVEEQGVRSRIYILPMEGGEPKLVTQDGPSYLHGWSPDMETMIFAYQHDGTFDIHKIDVTGENEVALTGNEGLNDGPEYDPEGKKIWFNSTRTGLMQIWQMDPDGTNPKRITFREANCWFPHVSPDGTKVSYVAYRIGDLLPEQHLPDKLVQIRLMNIDGTEDHMLAEFMGGQGTMNVNSWSPDSKYFAFVSY